MNAILREHPIINRTSESILVTFQPKSSFNSSGVHDRVDMRLLNTLVALSLLLQQNSEHLDRWVETQPLSSLPAPEASGADTRLRGR